MAPFRRRPLQEDERDALLLDIAAALAFVLRQQQGTQHMISMASEEAGRCAIPRFHIRGQDALLERLEQWANLQR